MEDKPLFTRVIDAMYLNDPFSLWLGIERVSEGFGHCTLQMTVRPEMLNGFKFAHGGISYSFADSALAFACNSHGIHAVSIETNISHTKKIYEGDVLTARAKEEHKTKRIGFYQVRVTNQNGVLVGLFKGTVYRTGNSWDV
jgi:acyl-CoA thioesterase